MRMNLLLPLLLAAPSAPLLAHDSTDVRAEKIAIVGGTVLPITGDAIENGTVLIEDGAIVAIGAGVEVPWDAEVIDAKGKVVMPGLVLAHCSDGMDRPNENVPVTPFISVLDAINPVDLFFEESLRGGIATMLIIPGNETVIGGQGRIIKPVGLTVESMTVQPDGGMKISVAPRRGSNAMSQMAELRRAFSEFQDRLKIQAEKKVRSKPDIGTDSQGSAVEREDEVDPLKVLERKDLDVKDRALFDVLRARMPVFMYCAEAMDVAHAIEVAKSNGFLERTALVIETACYEAADEIKAAGLSVILPADFVHERQDPLTGETSRTYLPAYLHEKGIPFALTSSPGGGDILERNLLLRAAAAVRDGLPRDIALRAITLEPARILGLDGRLGSLEKGKDGNVLVLSGDPLASGSWVEEVLIDGEHVYSKSKDTRLLRLTGDDVDGGK